MQPKYPHRSLLLCLPDSLLEHLSECFPQTLWKCLSLDVFNIFYYGLIEWIMLIKRKGHYWLHYFVPDQVLAKIWFRIEAQHFDLVLVSDDAAQDDDKLHAKTFLCPAKFLFICLFVWDVFPVRFTHIFTATGTWWMLMFKSYGNNSALCPRPIVYNVKSSFCKRVM